MANIQSLMTALTARQPISIKVQFDKQAMLGYKLVTTGVPRVRYMKKRSLVVRYTMMNEDLESTLGVTQI